MDDSLLITKEAQEASELLKEKLAKEAKKITRIPFYKLEELKKIEEKKLKNIHKTKKKEKEEEKPHVHIKISGKKPKMPKKKKEEIKKLKNQIIGDIEEHNDESNSEQFEKTISNSSSNKINTLTQIKDSLSSNKIHDLKYQVEANIVSKRKMRLSKKQQKLQFPENKVSDFLTAEDKLAIKKLINGIKEDKDIRGSKTLKGESSITKDFKNENKSFDTSFQFDSKVKEDKKNNSEVIEINKDEKEGTNVIPLNKTEGEIEQKRTHLEQCINKKRKRFTKYKKAIYKSRLQKKKYLYNTIFNNDGEAEEKTKTIDNIKENEASNSQLNHEAMSNCVKPRDFDLHNYQTPSSSIINYYNFKEDDMMNINTPSNFGYDNNYHPFYPYYYPYQYPISYENQSYQNQFHNQGNSFYVQCDPKNKFSFEYVSSETKPKFNKFQKKFFDSTLAMSEKSNHKVNIVDLQKSISNTKSSFSFETMQKQGERKAKDNTQNMEKESSKGLLENFKKHLDDTYQIDQIDINGMNGKDLNEFLKNHKDITKINLNQIKTFIPESVLNKYLIEKEGVQNPSQKKIIREYVDQVLDKHLDEKFSSFIEKLRDIYFKKKIQAPLKAKKRFVIGMREVEKFIRLNELLCLFVVPNIEKVEAEKNSLDERLINIFYTCRKKNIQIIFGLNKFKLGKAARKKNSSASMLGLINVEGFENELKDLIEFGKKFQKEWYLKHYDERGKFENNKFIDYELFEYYHSNSQEDLTENQNVNK